MIRDFFTDVLKRRIFLKMNSALMCQEAQNIEHQGRDYLTNAAKIPSAVTQYQSMCAVNSRRCSTIWIQIILPLFFPQKHLKNLSLAHPHKVKTDGQIKTGFRKLASCERNACSSAGCRNHLLYLSSFSIPSAAVTVVPPSTISVFASVAPSRVFESNFLSTVSRLTMTFFAWDSDAVHALPMFSQLLWQTVILESIYIWQQSR